MTAPAFEWRSRGFAFVPVPFAADAWRYLAAAEGDTTNRAAPALDDSSWSVAAAPFGSGVGSGVSWPAPATVTPTSVSLWLRRTIRTAPSTPLTIGVRYDGNATLYWNGEPLAALGESLGLTPDLTVAVPGELVLATNTLALRVNDDAGDPLIDYTYADLSVDLA